MRSLPLAGPGDTWGTDTAVGFGAFTLDLRAGQLRRAGTALPLRPKTWAVLLYLIQRAGSLVTKEELLDTVWPDVAVTPDTLNKSIGELRSTLGDDIKQPRFIETVHRRGFRFLAMPRLPSGVSAWFPGSFRASSGLLLPPCHAGGVMTRDRQVTPMLPAWKAFVVQFAAHAGLRGEPCFGRVEHLASGRRLRFESREELIEALAKLLDELGEAEE